MKIIVCQPNKQHVNAFLTGLNKHGVLQRFYTGLAANKITPPQYFGLRVGFLDRFFEKIRAKAKKRAYTDIENNQIRHSPFLFGAMQWVKSEYWSVRLPYQWFDLWTKRCLAHEDYDIVVGYENTTLHTFTAAKAAQKITVLDMAAVHHQFQNPVLESIGTYTDSAETNYICQRKEAAYKVTDYIITLSKFAEKSLLDAGIPADRIYFTHLGYNQKVFLPKKNYTTEATEKPFELYFVGTMSRRKALPFLVKISEQLVAEGLNIRLTLIGPLDDFDAAALQQPFIRYIPFVSHAELVTLHHQLDVFVFPSNIDSWAQVVIEAMACGSPVLVSENTGAKDAVERGGGWILKVGDTEGWLEALKKLYFDRFLVKKLGEEAAFVAKQFSWENYHKQVFEALSDIYKRSR